ncbi:hypothetical protein Bca52824_080505 [Brassica carinata]|uniref:Protein CLP1 homolog n=1 Tax=Brassica carinata TaxID=52824 RepID=A0A8X7PDH1_BRACI|nr:hypothetical protein Bca52824_080505 [Brassica carinata]
MSYNGPSMNPPPTIVAVSTSSKHVKLEGETELRIEVSDTPLKLRVVNGTAQTDGTTETDYTADETPMVSYLNVHAILNARRRDAQASESTQGPRVIVVGPEDSGKRTLAMLINWAAKEAWKPTFVDFDVTQGSVSIPGSVAATPIETPLDPVVGFPLDMPLVYYYGHTKPGTNVELYKATVMELGRVLERQFLGNHESRVLLHAIETFNASIVLVLGQEKLYSKLKHVLSSKSNVDVVKLHKSGGVVAKNSEFRKTARSCRIQEYFDTTHSIYLELSPYANTSSFSDVKVFRIGGRPQAPRSALPMGSDPVSDPLKVTHVNIDDRDVLHSVLAVSYAQEPDRIVSSNVSGFVYVTEVDVQRKTITYLAPSQGTLPSKFLVARSLSWKKR